MSGAVSEILTKAADLLEKPGAWTQGAWARDAIGDVPAKSGEGAVCWCLFGACVEAGGKGFHFGQVERFITAVTKEFPIAWNDAPGRTQAEVVSALREAARKSAEAGE